jgi:hypothetical protein
MTINLTFSLHLISSVADPVLFDPRILDPGWGEIGSGSGMNNPDHYSESLETVFRAKNT